MRERWRIGGGLFELKVEGKASRGKDARRGRKKRTGQGGKRLGAVLIYIVSYYNNNGCSVLFITTVIFLKKSAVQLSLWKHSAVFGRGRTDDLPMEEEEKCFVLLQ
jgi:hypothetical protein